MVQEKCENPFKRTRTLSHTHTRTRTHIHAHTHSHTLTHTHTYSLPSLPLRCSRWCRRWILINATRSVPRLALRRASARYVRVYIFSSKIQRFCLRTICCTVVRGSSNWESGRDFFLVVSLSFRLSVRISWSCRVYSFYVDLLQAHVLREVQFLSNTSNWDA